MSLAINPRGGLAYTSMNALAPMAPRVTLRPSSARRNSHLRVPGISTAARNVVPHALSDKVDDAIAASDQFINSDEMIVDSMDDGSAAPCDPNMSAADIRARSRERFRQKKKEKSRLRLLINIAAVSGVCTAAFFVHPLLADIVKAQLSLSSDAAPQLAGAFMGGCSFLFAVNYGNTLGMLDQRKQSVAQIWSSEIIVLEQATSFVIKHGGEDKQAILEPLLEYAEGELLDCSNLAPPYDVHSPLSKLQDVAWDLKDERVAKELDTRIEQLANFQNQRLSEYANELPATHWAYITFLAVAFLVTLIMFERPPELSDNGKSFIFAIASGMMISALLSLVEMSDHVTGLYSPWTELSPRVAKLKLQIKRVLGEVAAPRGHAE